MKKDGPKHKTDLFPKLQSGRSQTTEMDVQSERVETTHNQGFQ